MLDMVVSVRQGIVFTDHAFKRLSERCFRFGFNIEDAVSRTINTVRQGKRISSVRNKVVYYHYFNGGYSFFAVCIRKGRRLIIIKTVVIKWGRR